MSAIIFVRNGLVASQSPDEDSLSSDITLSTLRVFVPILGGLNPLTRIHCLPTQLILTAVTIAVLGTSQSPDEDSLSSDISLAPTCAAPTYGLNPLTRIHCLPTLCWRLGGVAHGVSIP